jgi:AcrR family transcriptional regulator
MAADTRKRMVAGAVDLIRRRGVNATSLREVVRHTDTPRGSITHHFPQGKQQLVTEALVLAHAEVSTPLAHLVARLGVVAGLRAFIDGWRQLLESSDFDAGCPVLAAAVEHYVGDDGQPNTVAQTALLHTANDAFADWQRILEQGLVKEGLDPAHARRLSTLVIAAIEGTVALCRAARASTALTDVQIELEALLVREIAAAGP